MLQMFQNAYNHRRYYLTGFCFSGSCLTTPGKPEDGSVYCCLLI